MDHLLTNNRQCKYCTDNLLICTDEGLTCSECNSSVHVKCLKRGSVPGGLHGDLFYEFTCQECSSSEIEIFSRSRISWLQVIILVLYHLQNKSPGLARKGFFHWRNHVASFIDKNWELLFPKDNRKKNKWTGTIAGTLSHFGSYIFMSGTFVFKEQAWWTLAHPKLSPFVTSTLYSLLTLEKQKIKIKNEKKMLSDAELFNELAAKHIKNTVLLQRFDITKIQVDIKEEVKEVEPKKVLGKLSKNSSENKRKNLFAIGEGTTSKRSKMSSIFSDELLKELPAETSSSTNSLRSAKNNVKQPVKLLDPMCHYNTSLNSIARIKGQQMQTKLMGGIRKEMILSPYSGIYLKPYIRRDTETYPAWVKLMTEIQIKANKNNDDYELPTRAPIDYTYVQPEHIPAINSLCNQFFWPGIDLTESLQYPDFSCVALYKKLIIGFAFLVPDVKHTENYISFVFTRPAWRNCGIAKFMVYHLIQTSLGRDITLHVSLNSPALLLYQKFGFKVEHVVLDFYDKYYRSDVNESKHAFFCRLER